MKNIIEQLLGHQSLSQEESREVMYNIMSGEYNDAQISGFLIALRAKGESLIVILVLVGLYKVFKK